LTAFTAALLLSACTGGGPSAPQDLPPLPAADTPVLAPEAPGEARAQRELTLVFTGDVQGEIEPCGCPTLPFGGFARRQRLLARLPTVGPVFQLDAGELLVKGVSSDRADHRDRARLMLDLSAAVGVDAWVPGPSDLLGLDIAELQRRTAPRALSATWTDADDKLLFPPALVLERDGRRLGVIGLSGTPAGVQAATGIQVRDPVQAARDALAELPADLDLVVALGNIDDAQADRVAQEVPGLAALLVTAGTSYDDVRRVAGVPIIETPDRGRFLQVVDTHLGSTPDHGLEQQPAATTWRSLLALRGQAAAGGPSPALDAAEAALQAEARGRNLAWLESRPLAEDLAGPAEVDARIEAFKRDVLHEAAKRAAAPPPPRQPGYATAAACTTCHLDEFARWSFSEHAKAWQSLVVRQATGNAECLPCHTTGFGKPGGLGEPTTLALRQFKGVQCEACHGPMRNHPEDKSVHGQPVTPELCQTCHDKANSPDFAFDSYLRQATCQGGKPEIHPLE